jgi:hypothetical protein
MAHEYIHGKAKPASSIYCLLLRNRTSSSIQQASIVRTNPTGAYRFRALLQDRYGYSKVKAKFEAIRLIKEFYGKNKRLKNN